MKTFEVILTKSYIVKIQAKNKNSAKELSMFFTSDIEDIANKTDMEKNNFKIEDIDCKSNDVFEIIELNEYN